MAEEQVIPAGVETAPTLGQHRFIAISWTFSAMVLGDQTYLASKPIAALYALMHAIPFLVVIGVALRRRFSRSETLPKRLPAQSRLLRNLTRLQLWSIGLAGLLCFLSLYEHHILGHGRHDPWVTVPNDTCWLLLGWNYLLQMYILERKPLSPPKDSRPRWEDAKPLHSDNWGGRGRLTN